MADSILDTVNAAYADLETAESPTTVPEAPTKASEAPISSDETDEQKAERARDEQGRFAKAQKEEPKRETLKLKEKPPAVASPPVPTTPVSAPGEPAAPAPAKIAAPQEWSGLAKVKWDKLPPAVQQEIVQREEQRGAATADLMPVKELLDVNREFLVNQAGSVPAAFTQLMQFARMSVDNPVALAEHILRSRGIDPRQAFAGQPQGAPQQTQAPDDARVAQLVDQRLQPFLAQAEQQQTQQLQSTIDQFASDPKHPFFNDVKYDMGVLIDASIKRGRPITMEKAYEKACKMDDAISAHLEQEAREAAEASRAATVQKAQQARRASVTGPPINGALSTGGGPKGSIRDQVAETWEDLAAG